MANKRILPVLVGVAGLLALVFWWTRGDGGARGSGAAATEVSATGPAAPAGEVELDAAESLAAETGSPGPAAAREAVPLEAQPAEATAATQPEAPRVGGRIVDEAGRGVAGATVTLKTARGGPVFLRGNEPAPGHTSLTAADGRFAFEEVDPGSLRLNVRAAGFAPLRKTGLTLPDVSEHDLGTFELAPGALLSGRVVDAHGQGVEGAELLDVSPSSYPNLFGGAEAEPTAVTDADGAFRIEWLATGSWNLVARADGLPAKFFSGEALEPGLDAGPVLLELELEASIEGTVVAADGTELSSLSVGARTAGGNVFRMGSNDDGRKRFLERALGGSLTSEVAADGSFRIDGLVKDRDYKLNAVPAGRDQRFSMGFGGAAAGAIAAGGESGVEVLYESRGGLAFRVVDEDGIPVEEFTASAGGRFARTPLRDDEGKTLRKHPGGYASFEEVARWDDGVSLQVEAPGYATYERGDLELMAGELLELGDIQLESVPLVRVSVVEASTGRPVEGARVVLKPTPKAGDDMQFQLDIEDDGDMVTMGGGSRRSGRTNALGEALLSAFPGELCTLEVNSKSHAIWSQPDLELERDADTSVAVELLRGGQVAVTVFDPEGQPVVGTRVRHRPPGEDDARFQILGRMDPGGRFSSTTDGNGVAVFDHLAPGRHGFLLAKAQSLGGGGGFVSIRREGNAAPSAPQEPWAFVEVADGGEHALTLHSEPVGVLTGRVLEAGAPLAGAELSLREKQEGGGEPMPGGMRMMSFGGGPQDGTTRSDGRGQYSLPDLTVGDYVMTVEHPSRAMPSEFDVRITAGSNRFDAELSLSIVSGRVTDLDGEPLAGVRVTAEVAPDPDAPQQRTMMFAVMIEADEGGAVTITDDGQVAPGFTDADGRYELRGVTPDVDLIVRASSKEVREAESEPVKVAKNAKQDGVDFELEPAGKIQATVVNANDQPLAFSFVQAQPMDGQEGEPGRGMTDDKGVAQLGGLAPGRYEVWGQNFQSGGESPREVVDVIPGETVELKLRLP